MLQTGLISVRKKCRNGGHVTASMSHICRHVSRILFYLGSCSKCVNHGIIRDNYIGSVSGDYKRRWWAICVCVCYWSLLSIGKKSQFRIISTVRCKWTNINHVIWQGGFHTMCTLCSIQIEWFNNIIWVGKAAFSPQISDYEHRRTEAIYDSEFHGIWAPVNWLNMGTMHQKYRCVNFIDIFIRIKSMVKKLLSLYSTNLRGLVKD